jgi:outer membrane receptor protein involved in Fe transport
MSALYGRGGISGAIHYLTLNPFQIGENSVGIEVGKSGLMRPFATVGGAISDTFGMVVSGSVLRTDGFQQNARRDATNAMAKASWLLGEHTTLTGTLLHYHNDQKLAGTIPLRPDASLIDTPSGRTSHLYRPDAKGERESSIVMGQWEQWLGNDWRLKVGASFADRRRGDVTNTLQAADEAAGAVAWLGIDYDERSQTRLLDVQLSGKAGDHRIVAGATVERGRGAGTAFFVGETDLAATPPLFYTQLIDIATGQPLNAGAWGRDLVQDFTTRWGVDSLYLQDELKLAPRWSLTAGLRYDRFWRTADYAEAPAIGTPASTVEARDQHLSPKAALSFKVSADTTVYLSYGEGFSPAFGPGFAFAVRPPTLKPETARGYEAGVKGSLGTGSYALSLYRLDRKNLAEWIQPSGSATLGFSNVGRQRSQGVELETDWSLDKLKEGLRAYANYAFTRSRWLQKEYIDPDTGLAYDFTGKNVAAVPTHTLALGGSYGFGGGWSAYGGVEAASDYWVDYANTIRKGAFHLWHAGLRCKVPGSGMEFQLLVRNLFDSKQYSLVATQDGPSEAIPFEPRSVSLSMTFRF